jgi:adenosylhomocysteine nucleosidase
MSGLTDMGGTRPPSHPASRLAIIAAMPEELDAFLAAMPDETSVELAGRRFSCGHWQGHEVVAVLSGIGKVAASITATALVTHFQATRLIFTGVAGGLGAGVQVGDVVVANELLQHDLDALLAAARQTLAVSGGQQVHEGLIVSGDRFVSSATEAQALQAELPDALAVEMEGAAIAQVCLDFGLPFGVVRSISDRADDTAHVDFARFVREVASPHALAIVQAALQHLPTAP